MNVNDVPEQDRRLEQLLDHTLRQVPPRRAPQTLEARVLGELQRRAARPWWRRSFAHWPMAARAGFVVVCAAVMSLILLGSDWTAANFHSLHDSGVLSPSSVRQAMALAATAGELAAMLANALPLNWLYLALAAGTILYVMLFALGAAAYRTLYLTPLDGR